MSTQVKQGGLRLLLVFAILLPALVASQILWQTLTKQIYASYEERLAPYIQGYHFGRPVNLQRFWRIVT